MYNVYTLKATINIDNILCTRIYHSICFRSVRVVACVYVCVCYRPLSLYILFCLPQFINKLLHQYWLCSLYLSMFLLHVHKKGYRGRRVPLPICYLFPGRRTYIYMFIQPLQPFFIFVCACVYTFIHIFPHKEKERESCTA